MDPSTLPWAGGCRCGKVRIAVTEAPLLTSACHCAGCRKMTSSAFSLTLTVPSSGFRVTEGETVIGGLHGPVAHHHFCAHCMTWIFTKAEGMDWFVNVRPSMLDEHRDFVPFMEVWKEEALPWASTPAIRSYGTQPAFEDYESLMQEFAGRQGAAR